MDWLPEPITLVCNVILSLVTEIIAATTLAVIVRMIGVLRF